MCGHEQSRDVIMRRMLSGKAKVIRLPCCVAYFLHQHDTPFLRIRISFIKWGKLDGEKKSEIPE